MKKFFISIICIISSLCLISCNKVEKTVETIANETETTKVNSTENEEETTISLYDTFLWDTEDPWEFKFVEIGDCAIEDDLYNKLETIDDNSIFVVRVGLLGANISREEEFSLYKSLTYNNRYNSNCYKLTENQLHSEVLSGNGYDILFFLTKKQIYEIVNINWSDDKNWVVAIWWSDKNSHYLERY